MEKTLENLKAYQKALVVSELAWKILELIPGKIDNPTGNQFIRSADSISANIAEGYGRKTPKDRANFFVIARGSLSETQNWRKILFSRYPIPEVTNDELDKLLKEELYLINRFIQYLNSQIKPSEAHPSEQSERKPSE